MDTRLHRTTAEQLSEEDRLWALMAPAWGNPGQGTRGQRALACITYLIRDVDNGGLEQAIGNRDQSELDEVHRAFALLGADRHAELLRSAETALLGERPPQSLEQRRAQIERHPREWLNLHIGPLNEQFYGEEQLLPFFREFVARHPEEFFKP
jgi:hypothetical protein